MNIHHLLNDGRSAVSEEMYLEHRPGSGVRYYMRMIRARVPNPGSEENEGWPMNDRVGLRAVPFELPDAREDIHTLGQYSGDWLLLVFHRHLA